MSPPPPPPPPTFHSATPILPSPPNIPSEGPNGSLLLELFVYNGSPFSDHWAFFVRSSAKRSVGVRYHATGDVLNGFEFQIERSHDYEDSENVPTAKIPLQWIEEGCFDEEAMLNGGVNVIDTKPVCLFEATVHEVEAPGKSLGSASHLKTPRTRVVQRNCQTWIVEAADALVKADMLESAIASYLHAIKQ